MLTQFIRDIYILENEAQSITLLAMTAALTLIYSFWEKEYLLRQLWIAERRRVPAILAAQRNANHDVRNVLQEILAIVEIGSSQPELLALLGIEEDDKGSGKEVGVGEGERKIVVDKQKLAQRVDPETDQRGAGETKNAATTSNTNTTNSTSTSTTTSTTTATTTPFHHFPPQHFFPPQHSHHDQGNKKANTTTTTTDPTVLRVRTAISRMTNRLETSLRDGRNVVMDELSRLVPEISPTTLGKIIYEDYVLDPLVVMEISAEFPETVETDSAWLRTGKWNKYVGWALFSFNRIICSSIFCF